MHHALLITEVGACGGWVLPPSTTSAGGKVVGGCNKYYQCRCKGGGWVLLVLPVSVERWWVGATSTTSVGGKVVCGLAG